MLPPMGAAPTVGRPFDWAGDRPGTVPKVAGYTLARRPNPPSRAGKTGHLFRLKHEWREPTGYGIINLRRC